MADEGARSLARIMQRMNAIPEAVREAVKPELAKQGNDMAVMMRIMAPRDTGALQESIEVTQGNSSTPMYSQPGGRVVVPALAVAVTAGNEEVRYAHLVEHGHAGEGGQAQPFFWPAVRLLRKKTATKIKGAVRKAVKQNWGKP